MATTKDQLRGQLEQGACTGPRLWTSAPGPNEDKPINCVTWYELFAFCAWDGGRLATEAEWNFAAAGGDEQRVFPWSSPPDSPLASTEHAVYSADNVWIDSPENVGGRPKGIGRWQQFDLAGNVSETLLDVFIEQPTGTCLDCAALTPLAGSGRAMRGGGFGGLDWLRVNNRDGFLAKSRATGIGARCARDR